jgi:hypothetical protein
MTPNRCRCGFPLTEDDKKCVACLPAQFRVTTGRYNQSIIESMLNEASS